MWRFPIPRSAVRAALVGAILGALLFAAFINDAEHTITGRPALDMLIVLVLLDIGVYVLVRTSQRDVRTFQIPVLAALIGAHIVLMATVRADGLYGNGRPRLTWRWQAKPADRFVAPVEEKYVGTGQLSLSFQSRTGDWTGFRGSDRTGVATFPLDSNVPPQLLWSKQIGSGWSTFAVSGDVCVTQEQRGDSESTVCYEVNSGRQLWAVDQSTRFNEFTSGDGPRATPAIDGDRVFSFGATGFLHCLNLADGRPVWTVDVLGDVNAENRIFGMAGSPLVIDNKVIVAPGGDGSSLVAYARDSGERAWSAGSYTASYSSPQFAMLGEIRAVLIFNGDGLTGHRVDSGEELFHVPWVSHPREQNNVCQPICFAHENGNPRIFISSGYGQGSALLEIELPSMTPRIVWKSQALKSKFASAVKRGDFIFGLDEGILTCIHVETGARVWKAGRYGHGQLICLNDTLVIQTERGDLAFAEANPHRFKELLVIDALDSRAWNHPALGGEYLLVRNDRQACCFRLARK